MPQTIAGKLIDLNQMPKRSPSPSPASHQPPQKCPRSSQTSTAPRTNTASSVSTPISPRILNLPREIRQMILLLCYDDRHEKIAKHLATHSIRLQWADTYDILRDAVVKTEWSFQVWLRGSVQTAIPQWGHDIVHVGKVVRRRQERTSRLLRHRRFGALWVG